MKLSYYSSLLGLSLICLALQYFTFEWKSVAWHPLYWAVLLYFPSISLILYQFLMKRIEGRPQSFVTAFMGGMAAKLFLSLIFLLLTLYSFPSIKVPFAISFMLQYLIFTFLNTFFLFRKLREI